MNLTPINLLGLDRAALEDFFVSAGEQPFRAVQVLKWLHQSGVDDFEAMTNLSKSLRARLRTAAEIRAPRVVSDHVAADGTRKWLFEVDGTATGPNLATGRTSEASRATLSARGPRPDPIGETAAGPSLARGPRLDPIGGRNAIETVFIPVGEFDAAGRGAADDDDDDPVVRYRGTLCISSQVGCTLACTFCSTGHQGFNRNLTTAEIIGQLWQAARLLGRGERRITNVVLMGMGEPLLNYDHVLPALRVMLDDNAYGLSRRRVTLSTAGLVPLIDRLREDCPVSLAVSLHAARDELRDEIVPLNRKFPIAELLAACRRYVERQPHRRVIFEYIMLDGVNDSPEDARALIALLRDIPAKVNLIPFNPFPQGRYQRSSPENVERFQSILADTGLIAITRRTRGDDIDAACGQLAGRVTDRTRRVPGTTGVQP